MRLTADDKDNFTNDKEQAGNGASEEIELNDILEALYSDDGLDEEVINEAEEEKPEEIIEKLREVPFDFLEKFPLLNGKPFGEKHKRVRELAEKFNTVREIAKKMGVRRAYMVKNYAQAILNSWERYRKQYEVAKQEGFEGDEMNPQRKVVKTATSGGRGRPGRTEDEKVPVTLFTLSGKTTTFKEIDKVVSEALGQAFHRYAVERDVYAKLGELLIYSLLQLGVVTRDDIVRYSEKLIEDPDALYEYVRSQLDAVLRVTDPDALIKTWQENMMLRRKVRALEATADMLADTLKEYEEALRFLIGMLDKKQLEKLATYVFMKEALQQWGVLAKGGGLGGSSRP